MESITEKNSIKASSKMGELAGKGVGLAIDATLKIKEFNKNNEKAKSKDL